MKKKPTAFIDSESEDDTEEVAPPKNEKKNNVVTNIESSDESDDDTGIFQDAESGILETPQQSPHTGILPDWTFKKWGLSNFAFNLSRDL